MAGRPDRRGSRARSFTGIGHPGADRMKTPVLITGGAGFIGSNLAHHLISAGEKVVIYDNLSRAGVDENWRWLKQAHGSAVELQIGDTRDLNAVRRAVRNAKAIFHFA